MLVVDVIAAVALREVPVGVRGVPLPHGVAGVVARRCRRDRAQLRQEARLYAFPVEVAADVHLLQNKLTGSGAFRGASKTVIDRVVKVLDEVGVPPEFTGVV